MKSFDRITAVFLVLMAAFFLTMNIVLLRQNGSISALYKIEANRIEQELLKGRQVSAEDYPNIIGIYEYDGSDSFYDSGNEYLIRKIDGTVYRIEYRDTSDDRGRLLIAANIVLAAFTLIIPATYVFSEKRRLHNGR